MRHDERGDDELVAALHDLGRALPGTSRDLSADVVAALRRDERRAAAPTQRRLIALVAILLVLVAGATMAARFGVGGVIIRDAPGTPRAQVPLGADPAFLGSLTTLDEARQQVDFDFDVPLLDGLGEPDVYLAPDPPGGRVSLIYPASRRLPAIGDTSVGLLFTTFRGSADTAVLTKLSSIGEPVVRVQIGRNRGWWIEQPHDVLYTDSTQQTATERLRFAERTLLWSRDGVTMRLESALELEGATAIAASVR